MKRGLWIAVGVVIIVIILAVLFSTVWKPEQEEVIKIGAVLPLSGPGSFFGEETMKGMELCNEEANLTIIYEDSQTNPSVGVSAFQKLVDVDKINIVITAFSSISNAIVPVAKEKNVPIIMTLVSAEEVAKKGGELVFRYFTSGEQEAPIIANYAIKNLKLKNFAIIYLNDEYGQSYRNAFKNEVEKLGGALVEEQTFLRGDTDFRTQLTKIKFNNPDAIYIIGYNTHIINVIKQIKELEIDATILTNWILASPDVRKGNEEILEGIYLTTPSFYFSNKTSIKQFKEKFAEKYGKEPSAYAAIGCDIVNLLKKYQNPDISKLISNLKNIKDYEGVMGTLNSDVFGEIRVDLYPAKIENRSMVVLR